MSLCLSGTRRVPVFSAYAVITLLIVLFSGCQEKRVQGHTLAQAEPPQELESLAVRLSNEPLPLLGPQENLPDGAIEQKLDSPPASIEDLVVFSREVRPVDTLKAQGKRASLERWSQSHALRAGPIPDYAPMRRILVHQQLADLAPELMLTLATEWPDSIQIEEYDPGEQLEGEEFSRDTMLLWMRDYHPIYVRRQNGELNALHYLSLNPNRTLYIPSPFIQQNHSISLNSNSNTEEVLLIQPTSETVTVSKQVSSSVPSVEVDLDVFVPLLHENGNLITAGPWVFVSERLIEDNQVIETAQHLTGRDYAPRTREAILSLLSMVLDVRQDRIVILPTLPHEATGHVDLYLMAINDHQVIIPKIVLPLDLLQRNALEKEIAEDVKVFLDERAEQLARLGLEVIRIPQLPPLYLQALDEPEGIFDVVFHSPTNGLLMVQNQNYRVLLPHFEIASFRPELNEINSAYEHYWAQLFQHLGWSVQFAETTTLARYLGLIHCVTATIPELPTQSGWLELKKSLGVSRSEPAPSVSQNKIGFDLNAGKQHDPHPH